MTKPTRSRSPRRTVLSWHKWLGLGSSLFVIVISVTGFALNHSTGLELDRRMMSADWLMRWYGIAPQGEPTAFQAGSHWVIEWDGQLFFDDTHLGDLEELAGAGILGEEFVVAGSGKVLVVDGEGGLLEELGEVSLPPGRIRKIGQTEGGLAVETTEGEFVLKNWFEIAELGRQPVTWFEAAEAPPKALEEANRAYRGEGLPAYRVLLDVHSGRFFGSVGVIIYDVAAILFVILAGTGIWLGVRKRR